MLPRVLADRQVGPTRFMVMATKAGRALENMNYFAAVWGGLAFGGGK